MGRLLWVGKQANYIVDERVQIQGARAYVAGIKSIRMPFHQVNLQGGFMADDQYVGVGSQGGELDGQRVVLGPMPAPALEPLPGAHGGADLMAGARSKKPEFGSARSGRA